MPTADSSRAVWWPREFANTLISGAFSGGYASLDASRNVFGGSTASGDQSV